MRYKAIAKIVGFILMLFSVSVVGPIMVAIAHKDAGLMDFVYTGLIEIIVGGSLWLLNRNETRSLKTRDGFLVVALIWTTLCIFAALPFFFDRSSTFSFINAVFESVSGLTTTGSTIITDISRLPLSLLLYRQEIQFLGGMGIVVLAVAILPMLGIGGMQLYRAETPGPMKDAKLTPRITETAKMLWIIYLILTIACGICYWMAGMTPIDAIGEAFGTTATGGFSMHNGSFSYYHSDVIDCIAIFFMFCSGINFGLHFMAFASTDFRVYLRDIELKYFFWMVVIVSIFASVSIALLHADYTLHDSIIKGVFNVVSLLTSTGFTDGDISKWPAFVAILLILAALIGACGGSTAGGLKTIRFVLMYRMIARQINQLIHPNAVYPLKLGQQEISTQLAESMFSFTAVYIGLTIVAMLALQATGLDLTSAFSAAAISIANVGAGLGSVADNFAHLTVVAKIIIIVTMLLGRLEIFTILVLLTPSFWRD
jgi:trk system potassium uptake protein TrkH